MTSGGASMSTNVPTLHKMATYAGGRNARENQNEQSGHGQDPEPDLASPQVTPAAAAAATVSASHASVCGGSRAEVTLIGPPRRSRPASLRNTKRTRSR